EADPRHPVIRFRQFARRHRWQARLGNRQSRIGNRTTKYPLAVRFPISDFRFSFSWSQRACITTGCVEYAPQRGAAFLNIAFLREEPVERAGHRQVTQRAAVKARAAHEVFYGSERPCFARGFEDVSSFGAEAFHEAD